MTTHEVCAQHDQISLFPRRTDTASFTSPPWHGFPPYNMVERTTNKHIFIRKLEWNQSVLFPCALLRQERQASSTYTTPAATRENKTNTTTRSENRCTHNRSMIDRVPKNKITSFWFHKPAQYNIYFEVSLKVESVLVTSQGTAVL